MELKLSDLDNYKLSDIDFLTLEQLETMTPQDLVTAVEAVRKIAESRCDPEKLLTNEQCTYVVNIINIQNSIAEEKKTEEKHPTFLRQIPTEFALGAIKALSIFAVQYALTHHEEIKSALIQAYTLLRELLN